jgi:hypothetical protein
MVQEHFCQKHQVPFEHHQNDKGEWWSHKDGNGYCNEKGPPPAVAQRIQEAVARRPDATEKLTSVYNAVKTPPVAPQRVADDKTRSIALAYAKDCFVAGKIEFVAIPQTADFFLRYINGN